MPITICHPHPDTICLVFTNVNSKELNRGFIAMDKTIAENPTAKIVIDVSAGYEISRNSIKDIAQFQTKIKVFSCIALVCDHHTLASLIVRNLIGPSRSGRNFQTFPPGSLKEPIAWCVSRQH